MKKRDLKQLALMGLAGGLIVSAEGSATSSQDQNMPTYLAGGGCGGKGGCGQSSGGYAPNQQTYRNNYYNNYRSVTADTQQAPQMHQQQQYQQQQQQGMRPIAGMISEQMLFNHLSERERTVYQSLSPEAKQLVLKVASQHFTGN